MRLILAPFSVALLQATIFAAAASRPAGRRSGLAIPIHNNQSTLLNADQSVNFDAVDSHIASHDAKILCSFENYENNTGVKHPYAVERLEKCNNNVPLINGNLIYWYGTISVGTPVRDFKVVFDTGSGDFFLPSSSCNTCWGHSLWNPDFSGTSVWINQQFLFEYADGSIASGELYLDTVSIAGFPVKSQNIAVAKSYSSQLQFPTFPADGVMGLGFRTISSLPVASPVLQTLASQHEHIEQIFSLKLSSPGAELYIGGSNRALYTGSLTYVPVIYTGFWIVNIDSIRGDGQMVLNNIPALIDASTAGIRGIPEDVNPLQTYLGGTAIYDIEGSIKYFLFSCNSFPTISLTFGGASFPIPPSALNMGPVSPGSLMCASGLFPDRLGLDYWIIGQLFLENVYTTFEVANRRVGFAPLADVPQGGV